MGSERYLLRYCYCGMCPTTILLRTWPLPECVSLVYPVRRVACWNLLGLFLKILYSRGRHATFWGYSVSRKRPVGLYKSQGEGQCCASTSRYNQPPQFHNVFIPKAELRLLCSSFLPALCRNLYFSSKFN